MEQWSDSIAIGPILASRDEHQNRMRTGVVKKKFHMIKVS
jgi:hypothetical protein